MENKVFEECLKLWEESNGNSSTEFWPRLAKKYKTTVDALRSSFKRERQKRGVEKAGVRTAQQTPIIASIDLECLPPRGYPGWGMRDQYITPDMITDDSCILSWSAIYTHDSKIYSDIMTPKEAIKYDSYRVTKSLMEFVNTCDIFLGFNSINFDGKLLTTELTYHSLPPVKYRNIDVYQLLRNHYRLTSNKLAFVAKKFGIRQKIDNEGFMLWRRCAEGDKKSLDEMQFYNNGDVVSTLDLFWKIQPYVSNSIPSFSTYREDKKMVCQCGCETFVKDGDWHTNTAVYDRLRCAKCKAVYRGKKNILSKNDTKDFLVRL